MNTHKFRKLNVWQKSIDFITYIYTISDSFPIGEKFGLVSQIRRAAVSIALNIAEGCGSGTDAEFARFLRMSQRSAYEVITALEIAINLKLADEALLEDAIIRVDEVSAMLSGLIKRLKAES